VSGLSGPSGPHFLLSGQCLNHVRAVSGLSGLCRRGVAGRFLSVEIRSVRTFTGRAFRSEIFRLFLLRLLSSVTGRMTGRLTIGFPMGFSPPFGSVGRGWATRETWLPPSAGHKFRQGLLISAGQLRPPGQVRTPTDTPRTRHGHGSDKPGAATDITDTTDSPDTGGGLICRDIEADRH